MNGKNQIRANGMLGSQDEQSSLSSFIGSQKSTAGAVQRERMGGRICESSTRTRHAFRIQSHQLTPRRERWRVACGMSAYIRGPQSAGSGSDQRAFGVQAWL